MVRFSSIPYGSFVFHNGYDMPKVGLGIARITDQESLTTAVRAALQSGYRLFDTARIYDNEHLLGPALKQVLAELGMKREDIFITTKVPIFNDDPAGFTEKAIKESLERLQTPYLDLVLIHYPRDRFTGKDDDERNKVHRKIVWQKLEELQAKGDCIRSIGVSNYEIFHLVELLEYAKVVPALNQCEYHPYLTRKLLRRFCKDKSIVFQAFSSMLFGEKTILEQPAVTAAVEKYGVSPHTILLAYGLLTDAGIIPKSVNPARIASNLKDIEKAKLTKDELLELSQLNTNVNYSDCTPWECI